MLIVHVSIQYKMEHTDKANEQLTLLAILTVKKWVALNCLTLNEIDTPIMMKGIT